MGDFFVFMGVNYLGTLERTDLQADIPSSINSIHDLRELYYKGKLGLSGTADRQETEIIRSFLLVQTGVSGIRSIRDLWVLYLQAQGVSYRPSLGDMLKEFFDTSDGLAGNPAITNTLGTIIGFPFGLTYAS